jgi:hypothetical protein
MFFKTQLPKETLAQIWKLADQRNKGELNSHEFCVAVHLVSIAKTGGEIPHSLPMVL